MKENKIASTSFISQTDAEENYSFAPLFCFAVVERHKGGREKRKNRERKTRGKNSPRIDTIYFLLLHTHIYIDKRILKFSN